MCQDQHAQHSQPGAGKAAHHSLSVHLIKLLLESSSAFTKVFPERALDLVTQVMHSPCQARAFDLVTQAMDTLALSTTAPHMHT
mmetsp:Transcript_10777/g.23170  ORF Transcript_10777/g.23170 Transcript_10777/m.23170 type:complete len:84 (+) Transcript_10777:368-619(+)